MIDSTYRLTEPLADLQSWVAWMSRVDIAVVDSTAEALEAMRADEDAVDANLIGEMISSDPLMTLKVLAFFSMNRPARVVTDVETVTAAVVMMGISPFFRAFGIQKTTSQLLEDEPHAREGLNRVIGRSRRAAAFALGFAAHRLDPDAAIIHSAALLHDLAEMLLWCHAPALARRIETRRQVDSTSRSCLLQHEVLNVSLSDLGHGLMKAWNLPELLIRITDDRHAEQSSVKCVVLAVRIARHTSEDWNDPALSDDVAEIADLLTLSLPSTIHLLHEIDGSKPLG